ncbi:DUF3489 domain-containing protein [Sphingobium ummariense]|uniref:DUF3489 domain-containing protein n=1 Tax=Sphingobium ummariense RL-3 TaxID=1346791 RepID=T0IX73_9SPHN|nr:DUF3489 domain-containing protein [Sphingobium ummariense]EQB30371.1 hypothetical protein M529_20120 [Sphingobium ummariense RL-3]
MPASASHPARAAKAIGALLRRGYVEERETNDAAQLHRSDGDVRYGLYVTPAGLAAIGVEPDAPVVDVEPPAAADAPSSPVPVARRETKAGMLLALLRREGGATLPELISATGWLPHTVRAALTGLRKKGHAVERGKRDEVTCYSIAAVA